MGYVVNSAIADPVHKEVVTVSRTDPFVTLRGYAVGNQTKGTPVDRVELSFDGGKTWAKANITAREDKAPGQKVFSWVLWELKANVLEHISPEGKVTVTCKCTDSEGTT